MLKQDLVLVYKSIMETNKWTQKEICKLSKLNHCQLNSILLHEGKRVSIEKMEDGLCNLGFEVDFIEWKYVDEENV
ncbi:hypothetical protein S140_147 [Shewanella sp. phage 1/40]|uniref:hypothetical protein n=1 Tax=Shewanella sp. phage 1/40 TaxID=1458860 RepID=UPI0004F68D98|nr:hypothetical protein S140_147 [Shewanella sp. phage 1/40]AHK11554.1 hypothetical protein S140_147 [Shewanella sp. phage 1/40]